MILRGLSQDMHMHDAEGVKGGARKCKQRAELIKYDLLCNYHWYTAVAALNEGGSYLDAIERGCSKCEEDQCDHSVGSGGR